MYTVRVLSPPLFSLGSKRLCTLELLGKLCPVLLRLLPSGKVFRLVATSLVHKLILGADVASPGKELGSLPLDNQVAAMRKIVWARVALLVVDMILFKVLLICRAQVLVVDTPAHNVDYLVADWEWESDMARRKGGDQKPRDFRSRGVKI